MTTKTTIDDAPAGARWDGKITTRVRARPAYAMWDHCPHCGHATYWPSPGDMWHWDNDAAARDDCLFMRRRGVYDPAQTG